MFPRHSTPCVCQTECQLHRQPAATSMQCTATSIVAGYLLHCILVATSKQVCNAPSMQCTALSMPCTNCQQQCNPCACHQTLLASSITEPSISIVEHAAARGRQSIGKIPLFFCKTQGFDNGRSTEGCPTIGRAVAHVELSHDIIKCVKECASVSAFVSHSVSDLV